MDFVEFVEFVEFVGLVTVVGNNFRISTSIQGDFLPIDLDAFSRKVIRISYLNLANVIFYTVLICIV